MAKNLRDYLYEISPPWLRDDVGGGILWAFGTVLDALHERVREGVKLRFPEEGSPTALGYTGLDRDIERPPAQTDARYAIQLRKAFDTWRSAGSTRTLLTQLWMHFVNRPCPQMRAVTGKALWHVIDTGTGVVTRINVEENWDWDGTHRGFWCWVIVDGTGVWAIDLWGDPGTWGDGGVWGSNMSRGEALDINKIARKWKPEHVRLQVIVTFDPDLFTVNHGPGFNVNGLGENVEWRASKAAAFYAPLY
jgi:hypothetical protein